MSKPFNARQASLPLLERLAEAAVEKDYGAHFGNEVVNRLVNAAASTAYDKALDALIDENEEMQDEKPTEGLLQTKARQYREREALKEAPDGKK